MAAHELAQRVAVLVVAPSPGKLLLALRAQHGEALGLLDEPHQAAIDSVVHVFAFVFSKAPPLPVPRRRCGVGSRRSRPMRPCGRAFGGEGHQTLEWPHQDGATTTPFQGPIWS